MYLGYFRYPGGTPTSTLVGVPSVFYNVYSFILPVLELIVCIVCRWLMWINQLLCHCLLEKLYIKFIYIFALRYKVYKKILCQLLSPFFFKKKLDRGWMVNQQVIWLTFNYWTSETARDITFTFDNYLNEQVAHKKKKIPKRFLEWFIGFTEGRGCFIVMNDKVYFDISVSIKDIQVLYYIKKELGFGKIIKKDSCESYKGGSASFYVTNYYNFFRLVTLFNGNLCTVNKKQEFKNWLNFFNKQYSSEVSFIDSPIKPSLTTCWLSGYIDAIGSFTGRIENSKELNSRTPYLTFFIYQREFYILSVISKVLNVNIKNIKHSKDKDGWILSISSFNKIKLIINYLKRYPLKTHKSLAFTKWCKIYSITLKKQHLHSVGLNKIHSLTKEMNKYL